MNKISDVFRLLSLVFVGLIVWGVASFPTYVQAAKTCEGGCGGQQWCKNGKCVYNNEKNPEPPKKSECNSSNCACANNGCHCEGDRCVNTVTPTQTPTDESCTKQDPGYCENAVGPGSKCRGGKCTPKTTTPADCNNTNCPPAYGRCVNNKCVGLIDTPTPTIKCDNTNCPPAYGRCVNNKCVGLIDTPTPTIKKCKKGDPCTGANDKPGECNSVGACDTDVACMTTLCGGNLTKCCAGYTCDSPNRMCVANCGSAVGRECTANDGTRGKIMPNCSCKSDTPPKGEDCSPPNTTIQEVSCTAATNCVGGLAVQTKICNANGKVKSLGCHCKYGQIKPTLTPTLIPTKPVCTEDERFNCEFKRGKFDENNCTCSGQQHDCKKTEVVSCNNKGEKYWFDYESCTCKPKSNPKCTDTERKACSFHEGKFDENNCTCSGQQNNCKQADEDRCFNHYGNFNKSTCRCTGDIACTRAERTKCDNDKGYFSIQDCKCYNIPTDTPTPTPTKTPTADTRNCCCDQGGKVCEWTQKRCSDVGMHEEEARFCTVSYPTVTTTPTNTPTVAVCKNPKSGCNDTCYDKWVGFINMGSYRDCSTRCDDGRVTKKWDQLCKDPYQKFTEDATTNFTGSTQSLEAQDIRSKTVMSVTKCSSDQINSCYNHYGTLDSKCECKGAWVCTRADKARCDSLDQDVNENTCGCVIRKATVSFNEAKIAKNTSERVLLSKKCEDKGGMNEGELVSCIAPGNVMGRQAVFCCVNDSKTCSNTPCYPQGMSFAAVRENL